VRNINAIASRIGTTKQPLPTSMGTNHSKEGMAKAWRAMVAMKLQTEPVGSTDFHYWDAGLREFSDEDLIRGVKEARDFKGYLTLGVFRDMCRSKLAPCHQPYQALPRPTMTPLERKAAMKKLRETVGI
jgi:hypothetical protein